MAQHQQSPAGRPAATTEINLDEAKRLLDQILDKAGPVNSRSRLIGAALDDRVELIREVLPDAVKSQAARLVKRALMYFNSNPDLKDCPPADFIRAVVRAAEMGLALDGKLCYCVKYKSAWQVAPDYKGLVAVAKRSRQILDCKADVVYAADQFGYRHLDGQDGLEHVPNYAADNRGEVIAAYASFILPGGVFRCCVMDRRELNKIRSSAPAQGGPWKSWTEEMMKKCPIRRGLKLYCDDPGIMAALEVEDEAFEQPAAPAKPLPVGRMDLRRGTLTEVPAPAANGDEGELPGHGTPPGENPAEPPVDSDGGQVEQVAEKPAAKPPDEPVPAPASKPATMKTLTKLRGAVKEQQLTETQVAGIMAKLGLPGELMKLTDADASRLIDEINNPTIGNAAD